jgi:hypothetical protein
VVGRLDRAELEGSGERLACVGGRPTELEGSGARTKADKVVLALWCIRSRDRVAQNPRDRAAHNGFWQTISWSQKPAPNIHRPAPRGPFLCLFLVSTIGKTKRSKGSSGLIYGTFQIGKTEEKNSTTLNKPQEAYLC